MPQTNVEEFIGELNAGILQEQLANTLSAAALATVMNPDSRQKAKVTLELVFTKVGDNDQVIVSSKFAQVLPTKSGKKAEETNAQTPMFVGKGGVMTINPPKEDDRGQFSLTHEQDTSIRHETVHRVK